MNGMFVPLIAAVLAASAVLLLGLGAMARLSGTDRMERLRRRVGGPAVPLPAAGQGARRRLEDVVSSLGRTLGPKDAAELSRNRLDLLRAGLRGPNAALLYQGARAGLLLALPGLFLVARLLGPLKLSLPMTMFAALFLAALGCFGPAYWLRSRIARRKITFTDELPDALDLLVVCVESGMGLDQAIQRVSHELRLSGPMVSQEFQQMTLELRAGKQRQEALRGLAQRVGVEDVNSLCTLLIQADIFGISVAKTLRVYSDTLRTRRYQRAEEKAAKLPVKLLIPLILCILPALFVAIMGPAGLKLMDIFARINH